MEKRVQMNMNTTREVDTVSSAKTPKTREMVIDDKPK